MTPLNCSLNYMKKFREKKLICKSKHAINDLTNFSFIFQQIRQYNELTS